MIEEIEALIALVADLETVRERGMRTYYKGHLWGVPVVLVYSRWGKVAAATTATCLITEFDVGEIIFTGVAGGVDPELRVGDVVIGTELMQHDMDARPVFPRHEIPLLGASVFRVEDSRQAEALRAAERFLAEGFHQTIDISILQEFGIASPRACHGAIASGDKFFADSKDVHELLARLPHVACVEMEGGAVAQVCHEYGMPFTVIRTISDTADEGAPIDFPRFIAQVASLYSRGIMHRLLADRISSTAALRADAIPGA